jgi:hypothetical protein
VTDSSRSDALASVGLSVAASAWALLLAVSPWVMVRAHPGGLASRAVALVYLGCATICHQHPDRSFHVWGVQMPVCARCFGLYSGAAFGSLAGAVAVLRRRRASAAAARGVDRWRRRLVAASVPTVASVGFEFTGLWLQGPLLRAIAALPLGLVFAWFVSVHAGEVVERFRVRLGVIGAALR